MGIFQKNHFLITTCIVLASSSVPFKDRNDVSNRSYHERKGNQEK